MTDQFAPYAVAYRPKRRIMKIELILGKAKPCS